MTFFFCRQNPAYCFCTNGDDVYIAGDVGARGYHNMFPELLAQLKGRKHLVLGNHDDVSDLRVRQQFVEIVNYKELTDFPGILRKFSGCSCSD